MILSENDMLKLPAYLKKILIDYMSELTTEDKIKVIKHQSFMIRDIIDKTNMRHIYMINNGNDTINDTIRQSKIPFSQLDHVLSADLIKNSFQAEYCAVKALFGEELQEFHPVIYHSSDVYQYGNYNDVNLLIKLARVAQAVDKLMLSNKPYSVKQNGTIHAVRVLCAYFIKSNAEIKKVELFSVMNKMIPIYDPIITLFNQFIHASKPKYELAEKMINLLSDRIYYHRYTDDADKQEELMDSIPDYFKIILRMFSYYCRIMDSALETYHTLDGYRPRIFFVDETDYQDREKNKTNRRDYIYQGPNEYKLEDGEISNLFIQANKLYQYTKEQDKSISIELDSRELSAVLYETQDWGHTTLFFEENGEFPRMMNIISKRNENNRIESYLLFKETTNEEKSSSQIMGISLNNGGENTKNKIIFEDLDIYSEYEIDFKN